MKNEEFTNSISLGWFCGTASSLAKLGLRSHSGPFDWYFSDFWAVLNQIESGFSDFMQRDNLCIADEHGKVFRDTKYGFYCNHDIKENLDAEYEQIYARYMRRAERFKKDITSPTVLFRTIRDQNEINYINENWRYAENLLRKFNNKNRLIYVKRDGLIELTDKVESYDLNIAQYVGETYEMRHMFNASQDLVKLCTGLISTDQIQKMLNLTKK